MVDVNSVLCFFEGYETLLAFDNQKSVFLFRDIWSLQTWCMLQKTLLRTLKYAEKKLCVQPALLDVRTYQHMRFVALCLVALQDTHLHLVYNSVTWWKILVQHSNHLPKYFCHKNLDNKNKKTKPCLSFSKKQITNWIITVNLGYANIYAERRKLHLTYETSHNL